MAGADSLRPGYGSRMRITRLLLVLAVAWGATSAGAATSPTLRLAGLRPLAVAGSGFEAKEPVRIVAFVGDRRFVGRTTASAAGRFQVGFRGVRVDRCTTLAISASGRYGSRASLAGKALAQCPEPIDP